MSIKIRLMTENDRTAVLEMMRTFYNSPAVFTNGSEEIFNSDIDNCVKDSPYLEGYVFEAESEKGRSDFEGQNYDICGYAMVAKSFSTEFGKPCMWLEDLYIKENYRGLGIGTGFFEFIEDKYRDVLFRLEVEEENERAVNVYRKCGYDVLPYMEMKKLGGK